MATSLRENAILVGPSTKPTLGSGYTVVVGEAGATATANSIGSLIAVDAGHGFEAGDKIFNVTTGVYIAEALDATSATLLSYASAFPNLSAGDQLFNLGPDSSGGSTPSYDAMGVTLYSDTDAGTVLANPITCDSLGNYRYYYTAIGFWELLRDTSGTVVGVVAGYSTGLSNSTSGLALPATATRGDVFTVLGGAGVADQTYIYQKDGSDDDDWTPLLGA